MKKIMLAVVSLVASASSFAATSFDGLTSAVSFTDAQTAVISVAGVLAGLYVVIKGARIVLGFIRR